MAKILVTGSGSPQANAVINCLKMDKVENNYVIGTGSDEYDILLSKADIKYVVPYSTSPNYKETLLEVIRREKPDMIHFQHDKELLVASEFINEIHDRGVKTFIPDRETIETCVHKYESWKRFKAAGITVPNNMIIRERTDVEKAFREFGDNIWLRSMKVGGGGIGSLAASNVEQACEWIDKMDGWGAFLAAELLTSQTITWLSVWNNDELIVAQGRRRLGWAYGALSASGVTGITRVCETISDSALDSIGIAACRAVSSKPHGVYGVDFTFDKNGIPNPTEINIGRFFTTVQFFAEAGLNLPVVIKDLALYNRKPNIEKKLNPLRDGLLWIRGMDALPVLVDKNQLQMQLNYI